MLQLGHKVEEGALKRETTTRATGQLPSIMLEAGRKKEDRFSIATWLMPGDLLLRI